MSDTVMSLILGFVVGVVLAAVLVIVIVRRLRARHRIDVQRYDESLIELRQERAEDKETNRRLRHELVARSPQQLVRNASDAELERDAAVSERDQAIEQLHLVQADLASANGKLADRESKLREYREALREIRESLEAQGQSRPDDLDDPSDDLDGPRLDHRPMNGVPGPMLADADIAVLGATEPVDLGAVD